MMQILYEMDAGGIMDEENATRLVQERLAGNHIERGEELLRNIVDNLDEIDGKIDQSSTRWKTTRMAKVDLAILRLAVGEMMFADDIPDAVAINEAIDLGKKYSTADSSRFIHGVLGAISKGTSKEADKNENE